MGEIYCLYSTGDGMPRYVGQTEYTAERRHRSHVTRALDKEPGTLYDWMRAEWRGGHEVNVWILQDDIIPADLDMYEKYWIDQFPSLVNVKSASGSLRSLTEVGRRVIENIASYLRGVET